MEYKKYAIFFWIVLIVAGTTACGGKDTVSKKDRIKDIEVYDDNNEPVTLQETEIIMIICYMMLIEIEKFYRHHFSLDG